MPCSFSSTPCGRRSSSGCTGRISDSPSSSLLWLAIAATIVAFAPVNGVAAMLMIPYLAWVSFASLLNFAVWRLNRV